MKLHLTLLVTLSLFIQGCLTSDDDDKVNTNQPNNSSSSAVSNESSSSTTSKNRVRLIDTDDVSNMEGTYYMYESNFWACEEGEPVNWGETVRADFSISNGQLVIIDDCTREVYKGSNPTIMGTWDFVSIEDKDPDDDCYYEGTSPDENNPDILALENTMEVNNSKIIRTIDLTYNCFTKAVYYPASDVDGEIVDCQTIRKDLGDGITEETIWEIIDIETINVKTVLSDGVQKCEVLDEDINTVFNKDRACEVAQKYEAYEDCVIDAFGYDYLSKTSSQKNNQRLLSLKNKLLKN